VTVVAGSKTARQQRIVDVLARRIVRSQGELRHALAEDGIEVTQTTLSRDLEDLGAVKVRDPGGALVYAVPGEGGDRTPRPGYSARLAADGRLARLAEELLVSAEANGTMVVVRTPPGAAHFFASAVDHADLAAVMGCIAGDDTILLLCREGYRGTEVAAHLLALASRTPDDRDDRDDPDPAARRPS
jgi:transcriptional regulator of arginine metabolism